MSRPADNATTRSLPSRFLGWIVSVAASRSRLMLWMVLLVACASVGVTVTQLQFRTSRADLMDPASRFAKTWKEYSNTFGAESDLMIVVETPSPNGVLIRNVIDDLGDRLAREPEFFKNVVSNVDLSAMREKALLFLTPSEAQRTASLLQRYEPVVRDQQWSQLRAEQLARGLHDRIKRAEANGVVDEKLWKSVERFSSSLSSHMRHSLETGKVEQNGFQSPLPDLMSVASDQGLTDARVSYIVNDENTVGVIQVIAVRNDKALNGDPNAPAIGRLRELLTEVQKDHQPDQTKLALRVTGLPALEHDEMRSTSIDMQNAGLVALAVVGVMLFLAFRGIRHPMLSLLTLIVAISWTFGAATLVVKHVNIVSVCFPVFLIGMGIDFSVSFINRYLTLRQELYELPDALRETAETTGSGILTSAITTALAFSTAMLTGYPGLAELGLISAIGVLLCAMSTFVFLPALIALSDAEYEVDALPQPFSPAVLRKVLVAWPAVSIGIGVAGLAFFGYQAFSYSEGSLHCKVGYDANLIALKDPRAESVQAVRSLEKSGVDTVLYAVSVASTWEQASDLRAKYLRLPSVARVSDLASKLPNRPDSQTMDTIRSLQARASGLRTTLPNIPPANLGQVGNAADELFKAIYKSRNPTAQRAAIQLDQFLEDLEQESKKSPQRCNEILTAYNDMVAGWLLSEYREIATADNFNPVAPRDLPSELTRRYVWADRETKEQKWVLRIYPKSDVWNGPALATFVDDLRTVDPNVTGVPVQNLESAGKMHLTYAAIGLYALAVISLVLLYNYLRPGQKLMTILPPVAVAVFIGYTLFKRNGTIDPSLLVVICLSMVALIAAVLDYRNLRDTALTLVPAIAGGVVLLGLMSLLGLKLNPVSLIALPLVFAIGIDNGIYLVADCRKQIAAGKDSFEPSVDTLSSILVTSLTSIVGFGSLMIASHQGLFSIGVLLALGVASSLVVSFVLMPPVLVLVARHQPAQMEPVRIIRKPEGEEAVKEASPKAPPQQKKKAA
jgi:predicted RND superfamily exporter protein